MESKNGLDYFQNYDFVVKWLAEALKGQSLDAIGIKTAPVEEVFAFEPVDIKVKAGRVDVLVRDNAGALYHIEEQRNLKRSDLYRFAAYHFMGAKKWGPGMTDVILASGDVETCDKLIETASGSYTPLVIDFTDRDGAKRLEQIRQDVANGTFHNWLELVVLPLYGKESGDRRSDFVEAVLRFETALFRENKIPARLVAATLIMANKLMDKERLKAMWEDVKMLDIVEIAREKGVEEGKSLGIQEGKSLGSLENASEMLLDLLLEKFGIVPDKIQDEIGQIGSLFSLKSLFRQAFRCGDIEAFEAVLRRVRGTSKLVDEVAENGS